MIRLTLAALWSVTVLLACGQTPDNGSASNDSAAVDSGTASFIAGRDCPPESFLTWENFGEGFMLDHCTGCHSELLDEGQRANAPLDVDFNTQAQVQDQIDRIYARSGDANDTMPPVNTISAEERIHLGDWLACGTP